MIVVVLKISYGFVGQIWSWKFTVTTPNKQKVNDNHHGNKNVSYLAVAAIS